MTTIIQISKVNKIKPYHHYSPDQVCLQGHCASKHLTSTHCILQLCTSVWVSVNDLLIYSVTLSDHFLLCLPLLLLLKLVREKVLAHVMSLAHFNFSFLIDGMKTSTRLVSHLLVSWTVSFVMLSTEVMLRMVL